MAASFEIVRPWLSTALIGSILALMVKLYLDTRKLRLAEKTQGEEFQLKVNVDGRSNIQFVINNLVRDIKAQRLAHSECRETVVAQSRKLDELRDENRAQGRKLDGLARQFIQFSDSVGRAIPPGNWSPEITAMMQQLDLLSKTARDGAPVS